MISVHLPPTSTTETTIYPPTPTPDPFSSIIYELWRIQGGSKLSNGKNHSLTPRCTHTRTRTHTPQQSACRH